MRRYITREDAVFAACKVLDKFGGCKMGVLCPDVGCSEVRDIIDTFQMIEIPDQHGRLVDSDALDIKRREEQAWIEYNLDHHNEYLEGVKDGLHEAAKQLSTAPTIIPPEPPKEEE